jgi:hypothetical protein
MTQGFIAGCTNYQEQTLEDIRSDIEWWIKYSKQTQIDFLETIDLLKAANYWRECVPFDFRIFCESDTPIEIRTLRVRLFNRCFCLFLGYDGDFGES